MRPSFRSIVWPATCLVAIGLAVSASGQIPQPISSLEQPYSALFPLTGSVGRAETSSLSGVSKQTKAVTTRLPEIARLPPPEPRFVGHARNAVGFYGGKPVEETLKAMPRRFRVARSSGPSGGGSAPGAKPFQTVSQGSTISPYLNLYREENDESAPNYYAFVRPMIQQQAANQRQQMELQRLGRRIHGADGNDQAAPAGYRAHFMNTGQFYSGLSR